jgi:CTP:molybdopterin cytidylyltransferase MocA
LASTTQTLDVVILADGINKIPLYAGSTPGYKALLPFAGKPAIQYTLEAVSALPAVRRIFVVGPEARLRDALKANGYHVACEYVPGGDSPMASVLNVLPRLKEGDVRDSQFKDSVPGVLFTTADLPLVTRASVQAFLDACAATKSPYPVNLYLSAVLRRAFTGPFARSRKGHMTFREGAVYHGNLALIEPRAFEVPGLAAILKRLYHRRKNPVASALTGGWRIALSYVFGAFLLRVLTMEQMARIASRRLGVGIVPVLVDRPEIAIDVDGAGDYELVRRELESRAPASLPS